MCGITGGIGIDSASVKKMARAIRHRGPDERGVYSDEIASLAANRLSIIDVKHGGQPMVGEDAVLVYNGELFNYPRVRKKLESRGKRFETNCDTEVVLKAFEEWGEKCVYEFKGQFAFAAWKPAEKTLFLARDRLGIMPLFYSYSKNYFVFASEIKALLEWNSGLRERRRIKKFLSYGDWTPFKRIFHVLPAHVMRVSQNALPKTRRYWCIPEKISGLSEKTAAAKLRLAIKQSVGEQMMSDVPLGVLLSGGLDSSTVAKCASQGGRKLLTFSTGMEDQNEFEKARLMAGEISSEHSERILLEKDLVKMLPECIYHLESFDSRTLQTSIPNRAVVELASKKVKVLLCGEGSDELFCGYKKWFFPSFYGLSTTQGRQKLQDGIKFHVSTLFQQNLQRVDKIAMSCSVESRVPLIGDDVVSLAMSIPPELKVKNGIDKYILRKAFETQLPSAIVKSEKQYFSIGAGVKQTLSRLLNVESEEEKQEFFEKIFDEIFIDGKKPESIRI